MPATVTHAYFSQDVYEILPNIIKNKVSLNRIRMFGQSTDPFMFYNIINLRNGKDVRKFQHEFHNTKTREYFINLINYIKDNNLYNDIDTRSYLYGFICHYVLDSTVHPYVVYKTGLFDKKKKDTYKYNNIHSFMEAFIDNDMIKRREKTNPYKFNFNDFCFDLKKFSNDLNLTINNSMFMTYGYNDMDKKYYTSLNQMKIFLNLFRKDKYGIKRFGYKTIDTFTSSKAFRMEAISYHYPLVDKHNFLNSNKTLWHNPVEYNITSHESFIDLYLKSIKDAKKIIIETDKYFNGEKVNLNNIYLNKSYLTGVDCDSKKEIRYFEF